MKMHVLSGGRLQMKQKVYLPDSDPQALIELPVSCYLLRHPQGNVLFDTGCHPSVASDAEARWGGIAKIMRPVFAPEETVVHELRRIGVSPDDIDLVVNSHFHPDHCGCNECFNRATVICHQRELECARAEDAENMGILAVDWQQPMPIETVDGQRDLFGDGKVVLIPLPGHTPGCMGALVNLERSGSFLLAADAAPLQVNLKRDIQPRNTWDANVSEGSMAEIRHIQAGGASVLYGHDKAQWDSLRKGEHAYD